MSPAEAGQVELEEPDWNETLRAEGYEETLRHWRRFHFTWLEDGKRRPAPLVDGVIALAKLNIFAPRSLDRDLPRDGRIGYQSDEHCWLSISGEPWRITGIEDRIMFLEKMTFDGSEPEKRRIDLNRADWTKHTEAAVAVLETMRNG